jgi:WD40 repeat protein
LKKLYSVKSVAFSPSGQLLAVATLKFGYSSYLGDSGVYDPETGYLHYELEWERAGKNSYAERIFFSRDGKKIFAKTIHSIAAWDAKTGEEIRYDKASLPETDNPQVSPDGRLKAVVDGMIIKIVDVTTGRLIHTLKGHEHIVTSVAFSPDGRLLASGDSGGQVIIWGPA